ncbi:10185_t:CDS:2 [Funneliformis geosporum]|uniref:8311_t:CDS:1 n=1 Tax=Funneliformis geosporum TaxID=1117311 RepID=A0A9W4X3R8_9GLOM|nr:8311_t:CDS:2 [Funneliformis geosporum]CAI2186282.1 10185_t:CDS:2 [Funneliformis geosporum]
MSTPISSEAEALRQAVLLSMRRETIQQNENQEATTTLAQLQQMDVTRQVTIKNDGYTTPPQRPSLPSEEYVTPEAQILNASAIPAFSPEEGEYVDSGEEDSDEDDFRKTRPITNPFDIMQAVVNGTNYERTTGNLFQRYLENSPETAWAFDSETGSPAEEGEIEEGEIVESELNSEEHVIRVKNADEEARELMKELYEEYGAQPLDIIEEGIPIDVVVRFTRELNHRLPPELEVFSVVTPNGQEQASSLTQLNTVSLSTIKLEPVEDNLPIINNVESQRENPLVQIIPTASQVEPNFVSMDRPFMVSREQNFIIDLSDTSDDEHHIAGFLKEVKSSLSGNETQLDAKRKLEEKEREIKRMNELIASKTELLKRKSNTTTQSMSTSSNTEASIDMIRAELEAFETAKSHVSELKTRLNEEDKVLESIRSEVADIDIKIEESSSLAKQCVEQMKSYDVQKGQMLHKREEIECRIRTLHDELTEVQYQIDNVDKEKESTAIGLAKKEEEYAQQLKTKEQHLERESGVVENIAQIRKQLGPILNDIKVKKERLSQMVAQSTKTRNDLTLVESSPSVPNKNGKRGIFHEPEVVQEETSKKPKLAHEVAELSKKIEQVSKEQQSLRESLEKKRQGEAETTISKKSQNLGPDNEWRAEKIASQEAISENKYEVFRSYESPLIDFRSFRFHPEYLEVVNDAKSFTYNNSIVPNKKMCAFELQPRGICNDDDCRSQHFRELPKTEKMIINDLTGYYEGENISQQRHYREGLHRLLGDLEMNGRDSFLEKFEDIRKYRDTFVARSQNDGTGAPRVVFTNEHRPLTNDWYISLPARESESDYVSESLPTPRMPTSSSSGPDDDHQQIYPTSPELEDEDDDGDYFSPPLHEKNEDEKYENFDESMETCHESDDQYAELSESESESAASGNGNEQKNIANIRSSTEFASINNEVHERQEIVPEQQREEQEVYAPFGYVGRIINWFLI